jgi:NADH-quinone oxidoreductase subunit F
MINKDFKPILLDGAYEAGAWTLDAYEAKGGYQAAKRLIQMPRDEQNKVPAIIDDVKKAGLRGRGGAGFPTGVKWSFVDYRAKKPRYLAINADESEPGTCKDRVIMTYNPHMLIEGILIACHAVGIENAYIYIRGEYVVEFEHLVKACAEAYQKGYLGKNVFGSGHTVHVTPHRGAGAYICGEETGLLSSLEGDRGYPKVKPPFPAVEGAWRCPTVVNNVQTIAYLPSIFTMGPETWAKIGPEKSPGTMIYCLSGHIKKPGLYENPMFVTMKDAIYDWGGGVWDPDGHDVKLKAVIPGGSSMPVMKYNGPYKNSVGQQVTDDINLMLDYEDVRKAGSLLGSAGVIAMSERTCMVDALYNLVRFYHHESCGQCTPCREGTGWLEKILARVTSGKGAIEDYEALVRVSHQMSGTTICLLSDSCAMPVGSFVIKFREEFEYFCRTGRSLVENPIPL